MERHRIPTLYFRTRQPTRLVYSRAKVIDMFFFIEGGGSAPAGGTTRHRVSRFAVQPGRSQQFPALSDTD